MMNTLLVTTKEKQKTYPIIIGEDLLKQIATLQDLVKYSTIFVITDTQIAPLFLQDLLHSLPENTHHIVLPAGEKAKQLQSVQTIWTAMKKTSCDRKSLVINLGGGVICDMGGFAASTYMRGVDFIHIPTTLLAQVDASIGGKTAIDFAQIKNLIGTFTQPRAVIIDTKLLMTLPKREFLSGFAEIIKHGLIADKKYVELLTKKDPLDFTAAELAKIITRSCEIKTQIVIGDETEQHARKLLNVGHTIGHAFEALSLETDTPLLHGEAISIGIHAESSLARSLGILSDNEYTRIKEILNDAHLPLFYESVSLKTEEVVRKMQSDKKNERGKINLTLLTGIGKAITDQYISEENIIKAVKESMKQ